MSKPVYTVDLSPRQTVQVEPSVPRDVSDIVGFALALFLFGCLAAVVLA